MNERPTTPITIPKQLQDERFRFVLVNKNWKDPFENGWEKGLHDINSKKLKEHLANGGNYGVLGGGENNLLILDLDKEWINEIALKKLPDTFTIKSGGKGLYHLYFLLDQKVSKSIMPNYKYETKEDKKGSGDYIGVGSQVVGANSIVEKRIYLYNNEGKPIKDENNKNKYYFEEYGTYTIYKDLPIATSTWDEIQKIINDIVAVKKTEYELSKSEKSVKTTSSKKKKKGKKEEGGDIFKDKHSKEIADRIRKEINLYDLMSEDGIEMTTSTHCVCPYHTDSVNRMNTHISKNKDDKWVFACFTDVKKEFIDGEEVIVDRCKFYGDIFRYCNIRKNWSYQKTLVYYAKVLGIELLPFIQEPSETYKFSEFVDNIIELFKDKEILFYNPQDKSVVEVVEYRDEINKTNNLTLEVVNHNRLFNIINSLATITIGSTTMIASPPELVFRRLLTNKEFVESLPKMLRLLKVPTLFRIGDKIELAQEGYNPKLQAYLVRNAPKFERMDSKRAIRIINALLAEFPFKEPIDKTMAIAGLITPACRGLYTSTTKRTPLIHYEGNRAGVGKDYLAGCTHIIYIGKFTEHPAISTEHKFGVPDEEIRKKITTLLKDGARFFHSSNLRGQLNSSAFEGFLTSEHWTDRTLGANKQTEYNNEVDISVSANTGFTYTNDMSRRMIKVRLFVDIEDITKRLFKNPDLHRKIKDNRDVFISAILSLILDWNDAGRPIKNTEFSGYTDWANNVGAIMVYHGLGDPCQRVDYGDENGDVDTLYARQVWDLMATISVNTKQQEFLIKDITTRIKEKQIDDPQFLSEYNFINDHYRASAISAFGKFFKKHIGRIHNGIKMDCSNPTEKNGARKKYIFTFLE